MAPAKILPLIGTDWIKRVQHGKRLNIDAIEMIAKVMWRFYPKQAPIVLELLKKEENDSLLKIFVQEGAPSEWSDKQGIKLVEVQIKLLQDEEVDSDDEEEKPAKAMGLKLKEVRSGDEHGKKKKSQRSYRNTWRRVIWTTNRKSMRIL